MNVLKNSWCCFLAAIALSVLVGCGSQPTADRDHPGGNSNVETGAKPRVLVTISKETTYITEPLRADGYPDYVAALDRRFSRDVTPENNAAVPFWQAMGPSALDKRDREKYFQMLGIAPLPEQGDYFVRLEDYVDRLKGPASPEEVKSRHSEISEQENGRAERPWSKDEFATLADWLAANEKPLALVVEASQRPRRYDPLLGSSAIAILLPAAQQYRYVAHALVARAMLRLNDGKVDNAWSDLLACHRLARLLGQGPTMVEAVTAVSVDGIALTGDQGLLQHAKLTASQAERMRNDLAELPPMPSMANRINLNERFIYLDSALTIPRDRHFSPAANLKGIETFGGGTKGMVQPFLDNLGNTEIDWDVVLRTGNTWYDRIVAAWHESSHSERKKAIGQIETDMNTMVEGAKDAASLARQWATIHGRRSPNSLGKSSWLNFCRECPAVPQSRIVMRCSST